MRRFFILCSFLFIVVMGFSQQNGQIKIIGGIPPADDRAMYIIQVGAFRQAQNAEKALNKLLSASLSPSYERYNDLTRIMVKEVSYRDIPLVLEKISASGFSEVIIRVDNTPRAIPFSNQEIYPEVYPEVYPEIYPEIYPEPVWFPAERYEDLPVSDAVLPVGELREIANRTVKVGETRSMADLAENRRVESWISSTPQAIHVDQNGNVTGMGMGNGYVQINDHEYISVAVVPQEDFYVVPSSQASMLPPESKSGESSTSRLTEYRTEPTFRLSYRFNNKGETRGASGGNGGIDILGRGADYEWLWTTYKQGGWFYNLNGVMREMVNGYQKSENGVELSVIPEFVYDRGVPYLQLRHVLRNTGNLPAVGQKFGASADVMIHQNDDASLLYTPYGAYMTDSADNPSLELMFIGTSGDGIDPVDTLWLGTWSGGTHLDHIYDDRRVDVHRTDSAIAFSYQNIDLGPMEAREFIVRFTLARNED